LPRSTPPSAQPLRQLRTADPRDRAGTFEPQLVKKHQTHLTDEIERKVIALFALGTSYQDIRSHIDDLYGIWRSAGAINTVTDKVNRRRAFAPSGLNVGLGDLLWRIRW
jgi:transposase-like protein